MTPAPPPTRNSVNYAAWSVSAADYRGLADLLDWAVLAPSSHNTQPWKFEVERDSILVRPDRTRGLAASDPTERQLHLSVGAAIANLKLAGRCFGWRVDESLESVNDAPATRLRFTPGAEPSDEERLLFEAIPLRAMNRNAHEAGSLPEELSAALAGAGDDAIRVYLVDDRSRLAEIAELLQQADRQVLSEPGFSHELGAWVRPNSTRAFDGMPGFTLGVPDFLSRMLPAIARSGKMGPIKSAQDHELVTNGTTAIVVLAGPDDPASWQRTGELFQRINLLATDQGLATDVYAALVETEPFPAELAKIVGIDGRPQMMFRLGCPVAESGHAPRRPGRATRLIGPPESRTLVAGDRPAIFHLNGSGYGLQELLADLGEVEVIDRYTEDWLSELYVVRHPELDFRMPPAMEALEAHLGEVEADGAGVWVYFPWRRTLTHLPDREEFLELLYSRNEPCIERPVQRRLAELMVGIAGLSVGGNIARALAMVGVQRFMLADFDLIAPSNLNRLGAGSVLDVGEPKLSVLSRQLYEFNPFLELRGYPEGVNASNLAKIMSGLDVFVDHLDDLPLKVAARREARKQGVTVLMATDLAFSPRFDVEAPTDSALFGGRVSAESLAALEQRPERLADWVRLAAEVCGGPDDLPAAVLENFVRVARGEQNFASQLGLTGYAAAAKIAYLVYEIARGNGARLQSFSQVNLEQPDLADTDRRAAALAAFKETFEW